MLSNPLIIVIPYGEPRCDDHNGLIILDTFFEMYLVVVFRYEKVSKYSI